MRRFLFTSVLLCSPVASAQLHAELQQAALPGQATFQVYDGPVLQFEQTTPGLSAVLDHKFSSDGQWLLTFTHQGYVQLWNVRQGQRVKTFLAPMARGLGADFTPDSQHLLLNFWGETGQFLDSEAFHHDRQSSFWSLVPLRRLKTLDVPLRESRYSGRVYFSANGQRMVTSSYWSGEGDPVVVYDARTGAHLVTVPRLAYAAGEAQQGGAGSVDARLSPDGGRVLVLDAAGRLAEYEVAAARLLRVRGPVAREAAQVELRQFEHVGE